MRLREGSPARNIGVALDAHAMPSAKKRSKTKQRSLSRLPKSLRKGALPTSAAEVWAAGLGALDASVARGKGRFDALVAEGRRVESLGGRAVREALGAAERAAATAAETAAPVAETVVEDAERLAETLLSAAGLPQRGEMDALRAHVRLLETRLAALTEPEAPPAEVRVEPAAGGWRVTVSGREASTHRTKRDALGAARRAARERAPSRLTVCTSDGTPGEPTDYGAA